MNNLRKSENNVTNERSSNEKFKCEKNKGR